MNGCNYCKAPEPVERFDVLAKMLELQKKGVTLTISTARINGETPAFRIRMFSDGVEVMKYIYFYDAPFLETKIDSMFAELKRGRA